MGLFSFWNKSKRDESEIPGPEPGPANPLPQAAVEHDEQARGELEPLPDSGTPEQPIWPEDETQDQSVSPEHDVKAQQVIAESEIEKHPAPPESELEDESAPVYHPFPQRSGHDAGQTSGYASSAEHLWDELKRIDFFVRARLVHWQMTLASTKPEELWGMVHVTPAEVEAYLNSDYLPPADLPRVVQSKVESYWQAAENLRKLIDWRLGEPFREYETNLARLQRQLHLSHLQRDLLLVCLLSELKPSHRRIYGYLQDDASRTQPSVELALEILYPEWRRVTRHAPSATADGATDLEAARAALDADGALLANSLVVISEARGDEALPMRSLRVDDRIADFLLGGTAIDGRLKGIVLYADRLEWDALLLDSRRLENLQSIAQWVRQLQSQHQSWPVFLFYGPYGSGRLKAARALSTAARFSLLIVSISAALNSPLGWERIVNLVYREATLQDAAVFWLGCEPLLERGPERQNEQNAWRWEVLTAAAERYPRITFLTAGSAWDPLSHFRGRLFLNIEFPAPSFDMRVTIWQHCLEENPDFASSLRVTISRELANDFQFTEGQILDALATAQGEASHRNPLDPHLTVRDLYDGCRRQSVRSLVSFARRIEPRSELTFDELVLPPANNLQLEELSERIQQRSTVYSTLGFERKLNLGKGLIALFTGASGTGKTMAAELLANRRKVDLYKVDLSAVSSKWVGETEKNLARVFAEAGETNSIIFFDEADALFGKRGEVKEAQDRWANMEVNYLLQRIEEYSGVVILASNLRQNIDEAFLRRIQWMVDFPFPDADARFKIYKRMFPQTVRPPGDSRLHVLANRFRLTGGSIKNVVVDATFRALNGQTLREGQLLPIHVSDMVLAIAREYQKLGVPINRGEFGETYYDYVECMILNPKERGE